MESVDRQIFYIRQFIGYNRIPMCDRVIVAPNDDIYGYKGFLYFGNDPLFPFQCYFDKNSDNLNSMYYDWCKDRLDDQHAEILNKRMDDLYEKYLDFHDRMEEYYSSDDE